MAAGRVPSASRSTDPQETRIGRAWSVLAGSFAVLAVLAAADVISGGGVGLLRILMLPVIGLAALAAVVHRREMRALTERRRGETESFGRILRGLSRSVSPDAIVEAIVEELGEVTGADHVVVVRLRPNTALLEATLVTTRQGVPNSTTLLPLSDLDDPGAGGGGAGDAGGDAGDAGRGAGSPGGGVGSPGSGVGSPGSGAGSRPMRVAVGPGLDEAIVAQDGELVRLASPGRPAAGGAVGRSGSAAGRSGSTAGGPTGGGVGVDVGRSAAAQRVAERLGRRVRGVFGFHNVLVAPLETPSGVIGALVLSRRTADPWPASAQRLMTDAAVEASAALARAYSHRAAETRAATDPLTGLPNRRYFEEVCALFARRRRADDAVGILMVDIDHFKALNDLHGHAVGDDVLRAVAGAIVSAVRDDDVPARYGGEEFVVLLRNPAPGVSADVGERVRAAVRALDLSEHGVSGVTVSVGVAVASSPDERIGDLIEVADRALYRAKRAGRDRVVAA